MLYLYELSGLPPRTETLLISEYRPGFLPHPSEVEATYEVEDKIDYFLIRLSVRGDLIVLCQRCMQEFTLAYDNSTVIAVCPTEERAERIQAQYDCIVANKGTVVLEDIVRDDLHLYLPPSHPDSNDCDKEALQNLT